MRTRARRSRGRSVEMPVELAEVGSARSSEPPGCLGTAPVSSSCNSTPSAKTSVAVVIASARSCSGAAPCARHRRSGRGDLAAVRFAEQLGDPEVEQTHFAVGSDQHVGGFEIAMHDQVGMRELDRPTQLNEELEPAMRAQVVQAAVLGDRQTVDVLEDQKRATVAGRTGIEQRDHRRVLKLRQHVALEAKALDHLAGCQPGTHDLHRHHLSEASVGTFPQIDLTHAPAGDQPGAESRLRRAHRWRRRRYCRAGAARLRARPPRHMRSASSAALQPAPVARQRHARAGQTARRGQAPAPRRTATKDHANRRRSQSVCESLSRLRPENEGSLRVLATLANARGQV